MCLSAGSFWRFALKGEKERREAWLDKRKVENLCREQHGLHFGDFRITNLEKFRWFCKKFEYSARDVLGHNLPNLPLNKKTSNFDELFFEASEILHYLWIIGTNDMEAAKEFLLEDSPLLSAPVTINLKPGDQIVHEVRGEGVVKSVDVNVMVSYGEEDRTYEIDSLHKILLIPQIGQELEVEGLTWVVVNFDNEHVELDYNGKKKCLTREECGKFVKVSTPNNCMVSFEPVPHGDFKNVMHVPWSLLGTEEPDYTGNLKDYWIKSSHNTCMEGHQLFSSPALEMFEKALRSGHRSIELDIWQSQSGDPTISHGPTTPG